MCLYFEMYNERLRKKYTSLHVYNVTPQYNQCQVYVRIDQIELPSAFFGLFDLNKNE